MCLNELSIILTKTFGLIYTQQFDDMLRWHVNIAGDVINYANRTSYCVDKCDCTVIQIVNGVSVTD